MKGLMVTLLMFLTTGIVVGQQGSSSKTSPDPAGTQHSLLKPLEIGVPEQAIRDLRLGKVLFSTIAPVSQSGEKLDLNVVNGVTLYPEGKNLGSLSKKAVRGQDNGKGVLRFGLTNADLMALQNNQLSMEFNHAERGRYRAIEVFYEGAQNNVASKPAARPSSQNTFTAPAAREPAVRAPVLAAPAVSPPTRDNSATSNQIAFGRQNTADRSPRNSSRAPFIPLPAPHEPGDVDFMGPTLPAAGAWRPPNQTTQNNPALNPRENNFVGNNNQDNGGWRFPDEENTVAQNHSHLNNVQDNRQSTLDSMKAKWEAEQRHREYEEEMARQNAQRLQREQAEHEFAQWKWAQEQELIKQRRLQSQAQTLPPTQHYPILNAPAAPVSRLTVDQQLAYDRAIWELERRESLLSSQQDSLNRKRLLLDEQEYNLNLATAQQSRNHFYSEQPRVAYNQGIAQNSVHNRNNNSGMHYYPDDEPEPDIKRTRRSRSNDLARNQVDHSDNGFRAPDRNEDLSPRVASKTGLGISNYKTAVAGPGSAVATGSRDDLVDGFVLFLMFCSLGLNFYLAFISRGFYVRYHELADELRETFSTTH